MGGILNGNKDGGVTQLGPDGILRGKNYYFQVSEDAADGKQIDDSHILVLMY